jgi:hypothetical protein
MKRLPIKNSKYKKEIVSFIKGGGKIQKIPDEVQWDMFPYNDNYSIERQKNEKGILDYEENHKSLRGEVFKNGGK